MPLWEENTQALRDSVRIGTRVSLLLTAGTALYLLLTLDRPDRPALLLIDAIATVTALAAALLPIEAIARRRLVVPVFLTWSLALIAVVATAVTVEDDPASPLIAAFFLPIIFAALAYPLRLVLAVSFVDISACVLTLAVGLERSAPDILLFVFVLAGAATLCALQAHTQERHLAEVARLSRTDHLTGTLNRRGFEEELDERLARFRRYGAPIGLVVLDLDGFKAVNDRQGHAAGDALLRAVAAAIDDTVRATDATSRVGGDEFAVLLEQSDGVTAPVVADRIVDAVGAHSGVTAGWSACPGDAETADELYRLADAHLYERKRNRPVVRG